MVIGGVRCLSYGTIWRVISRWVGFGLSSGRCQSSLGFGYAGTRKCGSGCRLLVARFCVGALAWYVVGVSVLRAEWSNNDSTHLSSIDSIVQDIENNQQSIYNLMMGTGVPGGYLSQIYDELTNGNDKNTPYLSGMIQTIMKGLGYYESSSGSTNLKTDMGLSLNRLKALQGFLTGSVEVGSAFAPSYTIYEAQTNSPDGDYNSSTGADLTDYLTASTLNQVLINQAVIQTNKDLMESLGLDSSNTLYSMLNDIKGLLGGGSGSGGSWDGNIGSGPGGIFQNLVMNKSDPFPLYTATTQLSLDNNLLTVLSQLDILIASQAQGLGKGQWSSYSALSQALTGDSDFMRYGGGSIPFGGVNFQLGNWQGIPNMGQPTEFLYPTGEPVNTRVTNLLGALKVLNDNLGETLGYLAYNQYVQYVDLDASMFNAANHVVTNLTGMLPEYWGSSDDVASWDKGEMPTIGEDGQIVIKMASSGSTVETADITPQATNDWQVLAALFPTNRIGSLDYSAISDRYTGDIWNMSYSAPTGGTSGGDTILEFGEGMTFNVGDSYREFKNQIWNDVGPKIQAMFGYLWMASCCLTAFLIARKVVVGGV